MNGRFSLVSDDLTIAGVMPGTRRTSWSPRNIPWVWMRYCVLQLYMTGVLGSLSYPVPWLLMVDASVLTGFHATHSSCDAIWYKLSLL
uniref:Uncharacterized protein n=1 Tax=Anguilla anguilla TaxID=7936 RepID=A0A0E9TNP8_ANGAN